MKKIQRCRTCYMPMKLMKFGDKKVYGCQNPECYMPELRDAKTLKTLDQL